MRILEYHRFYWVNYGVWINSITYCNFSVSVHCTFRLPASFSLIDILRKRYGRDLLKEVGTLNNLDFKHKNAILETRQETQDKKLCNFLLRNMGNNPDTCHYPDNVIFNFSSYNLSDHEKIVLPVHQKLLSIKNFWYPFKC